MFPDWAPWAVLIGLIAIGLLGALGVFTPKHTGPTAADVDADTAPSATDVANPMAPPPGSPSGAEPRPRLLLKPNMIKQLPKPPTR